MVTFAVVKYRNGEYGVSKAYHYQNWLHWLSIYWKWKDYSERFKEEEEANKALERIVSDHKKYIQDMKGHELEKVVKSVKLKGC